MKNWTIQYKGIKKTSAEWGIQDISWERLNQGKDRVRLKCPGLPFDDPADTWENKTITIYNEKDKVWFRGLVTKSPRNANGFEESLAYEVSGPWWYLENLIYQQNWWQNVSPETDSRLEPITTGRIVLGQNGKGERIHSGQQLKDILEYAIAQGAPFKIGDIGVRVPIPYDETKDLSCAEAIHRLLRWSPDAVTWFDYRTSLPTLHVQSRADLKYVEFDLANNKNIKSLKLTPRSDLQSPAVVLKYEKTHRSNSGTWSSTEIDAYPPGATGREFKALVLTVELEGSMLQRVQQHVKVEPILIDSPIWWQRHMPALNGISPQNITLRDIRRDTTLPMELIEGSIAPWMFKEAAEDVIRAKVSYKTTHETVIDREVAVRLQATNAQTREYQHVLSMGEQEVTPSGLAQALYQSVNTLHYDGIIVLEGEEVESVDWVGRVINIKGGQKAWANMRAVVQRVRHGVGDGRVSLELGPPKHLGADDLVELLRVNRRRLAPKRAWSRTSGRSGSGAFISQGTHHRLENTDTSLGQWGRVVFSSPKNPKSQVVVDAEAIPEAVIVQFCEEDVCENGILKKRIVLASTPYEKLL